MNKKVAFISGASRGIGRALALHLAREGWNLWLCATSRERLEAVAAEIGSFDGGGKVLLSTVDVSDSEVVSSAVAEAVKSLGRIDLLFNNAAINVRGTLELSPEEFRRSAEVNIVGVWNMLHATVPHFKRQGYGHIVNVSSVAGMVGFAGAGAYCSSKFAVRGLSESLYQELIPLGIKVTALCPSWVDTDMASYAPIGGDQMIQTQDICRTVDYLLSLSPTACVKELVVDCVSDPLGFTPPPVEY